MLKSQSLKAPDFRNESYWWNVAPPDALPAVELQSTYDAAIVGSGITGLRAAIDLARAGLKVVVFDRGDAGFGAARRNAGFIGRTLKKSFRALQKASGDSYARRVYEELNAALDSTLDFIATEKIHCFATRCGRFIGATSRAHLKQLIDDHEEMKAALGYDYQLVHADSVRSEMGSNLYFGGIVIPDLGSLHPGLYHKALLDLALSTGVTVSTRTEVSAIARSGSDGFRVSTSAGSVASSHVAITTNGYTPRHMQWYARRIIPFTGYMAATEELPPELLTELIPNRRTIIDSNVNIDFFRPAPDSSRLLFGGFAGKLLRDTDELVAQMHAIMIRVFPQLQQARLSAAWSGQCAATFDMMPHVGCHEGIWYGLGYNFAGVPMGSYFGVKIARGILGDTSAGVFSETPFKTVPLYDGTPWFVPMAMRVFEWHDRFVGR